MAVAAVQVVEVITLLTRTTPMMMTAFIFNRHFNLNSRYMGRMYIPTFETANFNRFLCFLICFLQDPFHKLEEDNHHSVENERLSQAM